MTLNASEYQVPKELNQRVLSAISNALREEKESIWKRLLKIFTATLVCTVILAVPFILSFREQLNSVWAIALGVWILCIGAGFTLYFYPQPRLVVPGFWSPMIFARLLLVSTVATIAQILVCPSFVFLHTPLEWNPLVSVTDFLMRTGGMNLCMLFCGFFFSAISGVFGLGSVWKVLSGTLVRKVPAIIGILLISQLPVLMVQITTPELSPFASYWVLGLILGCSAMALMSLEIRKPRVAG